MYNYFFKRLSDLIISLLSFVILFPFLSIVAVWLHFANKGSGVFFLQERLGKNSKAFKVIKFKTMTDEIGDNGRLLPDEQRLTKVGRFVRSTSLDEFPQLINVIKGDMSLIGPRPLTPVYLQLFNEHQARRMEVRPGITGLAQVNGRNHCKLSKKFEYDVWYVDHCSFLLDVKIMWKTIVSVLNRSDIGTGSGDMKDIDDLGFLPRVMEILNKENQCKGK